jgi:hypothetical protein
VRKTPRVDVHLDSRRHLSPRSGSFNSIALQTPGSAIQPGPEGVSRHSAYRETLHDLDEIDRDILRGQKRKARACPHGETGDATLETMPGAVHIQFQLRVLADPQIADLGLLEICVHPGLAQGADVSASLRVIPGIDLAADYDSIDFRCSRTIAQIELGLIEVAPGLFQTCLGLLQGRGVANDLGAYLALLSDLDTDHLKPR